MKKYLSLLLFLLIITPVFSEIDIPAMDSETDSTENAESDGSSFFDKIGELFSKIGDFFKSIFSRLAI